MKLKLLFGAILVLLSAVSFAQTCTSNPLTIPSSRNFSAITWAASGGAFCPPGANFMGNVRIHIPDGVNITMNANITINGNFTITNNGTSTLTIPSGVTVRVTGNMGDANNNDVIYHVDGVLIVDGTLTGKNNNRFEGSGSISGGSLQVGNGATCPNPCPVTGNFDSCTSGSGGQAGVWCKAVLPVKLLYFNANTLDDETVSLTWATNVEENFLKFIVQRSANGLEFEDIGEIAGKGFDIYNIETLYSFIDEAPLLGKNYYRLKALDIDDSFEHFPVKLIALKGSKKMAVYPNPSSGDVIRFRTNFNPTESDRIVLTNQLGVEIFSSRAFATQNSISFTDKLRPGIYMLRYVADGHEQVTRIVIKN